MTIRDRMPRTTCDCDGCQIGCRCLPGMAGIGDIERIADHGEQEFRKLFGDNEFNREQWIACRFVASEGAKVGRLNDRGGIDVFQIPTITPAQRPNGECVFYDNGRCSIHAVSPIGCSHVDPHMTKEEGDAVVHPALAEIAADGQADGPYWRLWQHLKSLGLVARPLAERRAAFQRLFAACWIQPRKRPESLSA